MVLPINFYRTRMKEPVIITRIKSSSNLVIFLVCFFLCCFVLTSRIWCFRQSEARCWTWISVRLIQLFWPGKEKRQRLLLMWKKVITRLCLRETREWNTYVFWTSEFKNCLDQNSRLSSIPTFNMIKVRHQSIPPAPRPPPPLPGWPPGISIFFALDGKFPGVGTLELSNPRGEDEKRGQIPVLSQRCNIFHWLHTRIVPF